MFVHAGKLRTNGRAIDYDPETALRRLSHAERGRPVVIGQLGQSLDGRIATPTGASKYINGQEALCHLHRLRSKVDAVVIGVGTAIEDNPQLTTRHVEGPSPVRVVIDPHGRMPRHLDMLRDAAAPVFVASCPGTRVPEGAVALHVPCDRSGHIRPSEIIAALVARGLHRVLVEGGAETLARFIDAGEIDELHLMVAPIMLGSGKTGLNLSPIEDLDQALRPIVRTMRFGDGDMLCLCDMRPVPVT